jgi:hypothetical protein
MSSGGIHIGRVSLRVKGVTQQQARKMADSIGWEIAHAVARESPRGADGETKIPGFSLQLKANKTGAGIAEQVRKQWNGTTARK